jgi:DnaJ-class molecular chaperone
MTLREILLEILTTLKLIQEGKQELVPQVCQACQGKRGSKGKNWSGHEGFMPCPTCLGNGAVLGKTRM